VDDVACYDWSVLKECVSGSDPSIYFSNYMIFILI